MPLKLKSSVLPFIFAQRESNGVRIAVRREQIDHRSAGIAEAEQLGDLVESFAGGIVAGLAREGGNESFKDFEQVRVASADDQRERGKFQPGSG